MGGGELPIRVSVLTYTLTKNTVHHDLDADPQCIYVQCPSIPSCLNVMISE